MENITPEKKQPIIKGLAIAGLIGIILLTAWLSVQIVRVLPTAIQSLASIANSVYNYNPLHSKNIEVSADKTVLKTNEIITLSWPEETNPGIYTFSYSCQEDISLGLSTNEKNIPILSCDKDYELGSANAIALSAKSDRESEADISYKISYFRTNDSTPTATHTGVLTISNPNLPTTISTSTSEVIVTEVTTSPVAEVKATTTPIIEEVVKDKVTEPKDAPNPSTVTNPVKVNTKPKTPSISTEPVYLYQIPVSNPKGTIDLSVTYLGLRTKNEIDGFSKLNTIKEDKVGILKFSVHNIGSKTSDKWKFNATLPDGTIYESPSQAALKPNEIATITIEFPAISKTGKTEVVIKAETTNDTNKNNNLFSTTIKVTK